MYFFRYVFTFSLCLYSKICFFSFYDNPLIFIIIISSIISLDESITIKYVFLIIIIRQCTIGITLRWVMRMTNYQPRWNPPSRLSCGLIGLHSSSEIVLYNVLTGSHAGSCLSRRDWRRGGTWVAWIWPLPLRSAILRRHTSAQP